MPQLVLIRHGQSTWNLENRFTGWWDVEMTAKGEAEAQAAGELMAAKRGLDFDLTFTSLQTRAIKTLNIALEAMGRLWLPTEKHWRLNERHYGGLTGLNKAETAAKHGDEQVKIWRRSFDMPPPELAAGGEFDLSRDRRYAGHRGAAHREPEGHDRARAALLGRADRARIERRAARADLRARQFAARAGQASVGHPRRRDHRAWRSRPASRSSTSSTTT